MSKLHENVINIDEPNAFKLEPSIGDNDCFNGYLNLLKNIKDLTIENNDILSFIDKCYSDVKFDNDGLQYVEQICFDKCYRITNKKPIFYTHTYNPSWVPDLIKTMSNKDELSNMFDIKPRNNCCNCISIVLYIIQKSDDYSEELNNIKRYLKTMSMTLEIVSRRLPSFVVRYYLDSSIFVVLNKLMKKQNKDIEMNKDLIYVIEKLNFLINHEHSEIFIYFCKDVNTDLHRIRTFRFMPMFEDDVNVCIIREADGHVTLSDCHNIELFSKDTTHKFMMVYEYAWAFKYLKKSLNLKIKNENIINVYNEFCYNPMEIRLKYNHYSIWLILYDYLFMNDNKVSFIDLLAGVICIKVKLNNNYFEEKNKKLKMIYTNLYKDGFPMNKRELDFASLDKYYEMMTADLKMGFDEIFLLELFSPLTRVSFNYDAFQNINVLSPKEIKEKEQLLVLVNNGGWEEIMYNKEEYKHMYNQPYDLLFKNDYKIRYGVQSLLQNIELENNDKYINNELDNINDNNITDEEYKIIYNDLLTKKPSPNYDYKTKYLKYKTKYIKKKLQTLKY